ncbi:hypothetical protein [Blastopirellula marina]|uniref:Uncharacterized protein n=1 Tax=Blastopirellula marina TaxID=124 RepID=A0A2S8FNM5_9BACT|nr:hypothetical protein [Blastopirellula marina]PQO33802.1 hypothetical protein C5Y98_16365 [Blastopirellula marina]PTL43589.1 hypothetical protein C5Y97_16375 [Blastopirellula marina]
MLRFNVSVHARPRSLHLGPIVDNRGLRLQTLAVSPMALGEPMGVSFEAVQSHLNDLPRMYFEPDGSFVWVGEAGDLKSWQVDGIVYDRNGSLHSVEMKGQCPEQAFDMLLTAFGWPETDFIFQLADEALFIDEGEFRRFTKIR